jgi:carbamoyl-phosphate synthase large subunit
MRSTGEVMGAAPSFGAAFAKAQMGAGLRVPTRGKAFLSVNDNDKANLVPIASGLARLGFELVATRGTAEYLRGRGLDCRTVFKVLEGRPHVVDLMKNDEIALLVNTPLGRDAYFDEKTMRQVATQRGLPLITTLSGAHAMVEAIEALRAGELDVISLQEIYAERAASEERTRTVNRSTRAAGE